MTAGAAETDEADSFASVGISTCLLLLCAGTLLAYLLHLAAQRAPRRLRPWLRPPTESWLWALLGLGAGLVLEYGLSARLATVVEQIDASFPTLFFSALLPPIIFRSGFCLDAASFARALWPASLLAGPGTVVSALVVGVLLFAAGALRAATGCFPFSLLQALLLGSVVSATDTVAVLTTLAEGAGAAPIGRDLFSLVYGESVLNDAVALVLFRTLAAAERSGDAASLSGAAWAVASFAGVFVGSTLVGVGVGCATALLFKHFRLRRARRTVVAAAAAAVVVAAAATLEGEAEAADSMPAPADTACEGGSPVAAAAALAAAANGAADSEIGAGDGSGNDSGGDGESDSAAEDGGLEGEVERTLFCVLPFLSYFIAEGASLSGVVAVLFCGIVVGKTAQHNVSRATRSFARALFQLLASLFEALVFVYVGIAFPQLGGAAMRAHWPTALVLVLACLLGRAAGVWLCSAIVNRGGSADGAGPGAGASWAAPPLAQWPAVARRRIEALAAGCVALPARASVAVTAAWLRLLSPAPSPAAAAAQSAAAAAAAAAGPAPRISAASRAFLWWCGLRGGVAFALALHARQLLGGEVGEAIVASTLFVVAVSLVVIPPAIAPLAKRLGLQQQQEQQKLPPQSPTQPASGTTSAAAQIAATTAGAAAAEDDGRGGGGGSGSAAPAASDAPDRDRAPLLVAGGTAAGEAPASAAVAPSSSSGFDERASVDTDAWLRAAVDFLRVRGSGESLRGEGSRGGGSLGEGSH